MNRDGEAISSNFQALIIALTITAAFSQLKICSKVFTTLALLAFTSLWFLSVTISPTVILTTKSGSRLRLVMSSSGSQSSLRLDTVL